MHLLMCKCSTYTIYLHHYRNWTSNMKHLLVLCILIKTNDDNAYSGWDINTIDPFIDAFEPNNRGVWSIGTLLHRWTIFANDLPDYSSSCHHHTTTLPTINITSVPATIWVKFFSYFCFPISDLFCFPPSSSDCFSSISPSSFWCISFVHIPFKFRHQVHKRFLNSAPFTGSLPQVYLLDILPPKSVVHCAILHSATGWILKIFTVCTNLGLHDGYL